MSAISNSRLQVMIDKLTWFNLPNKLMPILDCVVESVVDGVVSLPSNETPGYILAVDATGNGASWVAPASGSVVDSTIIDGSTNPVENNAIFDALALKLDNTAFIAGQATQDSAIALRVLNPVGSTPGFVATVDGTGNGIVYQAPAATGVSADAEQLLTLGTDTLPMLDPDNLISADAGNLLSKGTDSRLFIQGEQRVFVFDNDADFAAGSATWVPADRDHLVVLRATTNPNLEAEVIYRWDEGLLVPLDREVKIIHAPATAVAAADVNNPTLAEIANWNDVVANSDNNSFIYYTGDDVATISNATYVFFVNDSSQYITIQSPSSVDNIFVTDGTLTADRTLSGQAGTFRTLAFEDLGAFDVGTSDGAGNTGDIQVGPANAALFAGDGTNSNRVLIDSTGSRLSTIGVETNEILVNQVGINLLLDATADLRINGNAGTTNQVLLSQGPDLPPIWGTLSPDTIYTADGTLSGNRTVNGGGNNLTWTNIGTTQFQSVGGAFFTLNNNATLDAAGITLTSPTGQYTLGDGTTATLPGLDSDSLDEILSVDATGNVGRMSPESFRAQRGAGDPVDGTTVAYYVGQKYINTTSGDEFISTTASTDPDSAGTGSVWAALPPSRDVAYQTVNAAGVVTLVPGVENILLVDTSGGAFAITIAAPTSQLTRFTVLDDDGEFGTNPLTINAPINGAASIVLNQAFSVSEFYADGLAEWLVAPSVTPPFSQTFDATTDWGTAAGGFYTITVTQATHGVSATGPIRVEVQEDDGTSWLDVQPDQVAINKTTGDVSFRVTEIPDNRFAGRVIIS